MSGISLLQTALLLGVYVALAGGYGVVYAIAHLQDARLQDARLQDARLQDARLQDASILHRISLALYALHALAATAIVAWTPLRLGWKGLIVASSAAFLIIPPIVWRFLQRTHETEVQG